MGRNGRACGSSWHCGMRREAMSGKSAGWARSGRTFDRRRPLVGGAGDGDLQLLQQAICRLTAGITKCNLTGPRLLPSYAWNGRMADLCLCRPVLSPMKSMPTAARRTMAKFGSSFESCVGKYPAAGILGLRELHLVRSRNAGGMSIGMVWYGHTDVDGLLDVVVHAQSGSGVEVSSKREGLLHGLAVRHGSQDAQLQLAIVRNHQRVLGLGCEGLADLQPPRRFRRPCFILH